MSVDDKTKPETPIVFTEMEVVENNKMSQIIKTNFLRLHPEITSPANSDLSNMIRDEKMMYANLAIDLSVQIIAAKQKKKRS